MKHRKILSLLFLCLFIWIVAFGEDDWRNLRGIKNFGVDVEIISKGIDEFGVSDDRLKTVIELSLRREGIETEELLGALKKILSNDFSTVILLVKLTVLAPTIQEETLFFVYDLRLSVIDSVLILRFKNHFPYEYERKGIPIWESEELGVTFQEAETDREKLIISVLSKLLDKFLNDYYKANPKKEECISIKAQYRK